MARGAIGKTREARLYILVGGLLLPIMLCGGSAPPAAADTPAAGEAIVSGEGGDHGARVVPALPAVRINPHAPRIDGRLDDPIWCREDLPRAAGFVERAPDDGGVPSESTAVAVAYDDRALYVAFWCYDSEPREIRRPLVRRDRYSQSDYVAVRIDPYHDHQSGYGFEINAANVQRDYRIYNDDWTDTSWDGVWESATAVHPWGYAVEVRIPYQCLRFAEKEEHTWGIDFARLVRRHAEASRWSYTPISEGGLASNFGHLTGLHGIRPARHVELMPYAVASLETAPPTAGEPDGRWDRESAGLDVKIGLASNLTLDATINPDFGQVELDRPVLNLSTYETYFPEKRPFFLEGNDLFQSEYNLFYSRRIGRPPTGDVDDGEFDEYLDYPTATTILGAAKITGKLGEGTNLACLTAVTDEERATYRTVSGEVREGVVAPMASYSVLRLKQEVRRNSSVGALLTAAGQDGRHPAVTGAGDWRLLTDNGVWCFHGQSVFSRVDGEHVGFATDASVSKEAGKHWRGAIGTVIKDPHLHINDLGYTSRNDYRSGWLWMQYRTSDDWWIVRNSWNNVNANLGWNYAGENISRSWNANNAVEFVNNWTGGVWFTRNFPEYSDRETRGHGAWRYPASWSAGVWLDTDESRKLSFEVDYHLGDSRTSPWWGGEFLVRYRPLSYMEFSAHTRYTHDFGQLSWVENPDEATTIFATRDQDIVSLDVTAGVMLSRDLSCQLSAQGLLSGLDYHDYRPYLGDGAYGPLQEGYDHDYKYSALNSTLLVRWEYQPGSTLYLVWTRAHDEVDDAATALVPGRDAERWFSDDGRNLFLIKASYRLAL
jgi:hypothetical protein